MKVVEPTSIDELKKLLAYDANTGLIFWRVDRPLRKAGSQAFINNANGGYLCGTVNNKTRLAHRVAWALHYGEWPDLHIDHINGDRKDNRIINLRLATIGENLRNKPVGDKNKSGFKGVSWDKAKGRWRASISLNKKHKHLGYFSDPMEAHSAYCMEAERLHGEFANSGVGPIKKLKGEV